MSRRFLLPCLTFLSFWGCLVNFFFFFLKLLFNIVKIIKLLCIFLGDFVLNHVQKFLIHFQNFLGAFFIFQKLEICLDIHDRVINYFPLDYKNMEKAYFCRILNLLKSLSIIKIKSIKFSKYFSFSLFKIS